MIKAIELNDIPSISRGNFIDDIEEFMNSDSAACEVFGSKNQSGESLYSAYLNAIKKSGYQIKICRRKNRVFLIKVNK